MIFIIYPLARSLWTSLIANGKFSFTNYSYVFKSSWLRNSLFNSLNLGVDRQRRVALDRHYRLLWRNYLWLFRETVGLQLVFRLGKLHLRLGCWQREDNLPQLSESKVKIVKEAKKMPAVKKLHQDSENSGKSEYVWAQSRARRNCSAKRSTVDLHSADGRNTRRDEAN
jgi:hypothetical protein